MSGVYIMTMRDDRYWLVGPFDSHDDAANWNRLAANNPSDDPRWQTVDLAEPHAMPMVLSQKTATARAEQNRE